MLPKYHAFFGFIFAVLLITFFRITLIQALLVFFSSFLIDFDHYLYYVYRKRDFNVKKAYFFIKKLHKTISQYPIKKRNRIFLGYFIFHGLEVIFLLFILGLLISPYFFYISLGAFFHLAMDVFYERKIYGSWDKISIIYDFIKFKKLKKVF